MSRYFRILEKARLDKELFGEEPVAESAERFPSPALVPEPDRPAADAETLDQPQAELRSGLQLEPEPEAAAEPEPPVEQPRRETVWRAELAKLLGLEEVPVGARISLCPLGKLKSANECAAALGQWMAAHSSSAVLIVEAGFDAPYLARLFRTRRLGLAEAMASREPHWDHFAHDTLCPNLKILPAGRNPSLRQLTAGSEAFQATLERLSGSFENIIVVLPNPRVRGFEKLLGPLSAGYVLPVIEPGRVRAYQVQRAMSKLAGVANVACGLILPQQVVEEAPSIRHLAKQPSSAPDGGPHA